MIEIIIQLILGIGFIGLSMTNIIGTKNAKEKFKNLNMPIWFMRLTGVIQIIGGASLLIGIGYTNFAIFGGFWIAMLMTGAVTVRMKEGENLNDVRLPLLIGILSLFVLIFNFF